MEKKYKALFLVFIKRRRANPCLIKGDVKLWDTRKASVPYMYLTAHISRVYSLDWSFHCKDQLVTSAQDCFVKFFNVKGG